MQKNVTGQKWYVFAFDSTTNVPLTGDAANITGNLRIDGGAANPIDDTNPTELEDGYYVFDITQAESNGDYILITPASSTANIIVIGCPAALYTEAPNSNLLGIESDGDLTKVNTLDGHTPQTANNNVILAHADYGNAQLVRSTTPANTLDVSNTGEAGLDFDNIKDATGAHTLTNITVPVVTTNTDMVGTANAALASVCTEGRLAELDAANLPTDIADVKTVADAIPTAAEVNAEMVDVLKTDTSTLPGQGAPTATPTFEEAVMYLYKCWRNKIDNDGTQNLLYDDAGTTVDQKQATTSAAGTLTTAEWVSGP